MPRHNPDAVLSRDQRSVSVGTTSTVLLGGNPRRWALLIGAPNANRISLDFQRAAVLDQGITLYPSGPPLLLTHADFG